MNSRHLLRCLVLSGFWFLNFFFFFHFISISILFTCLFMYSLLLGLFFYPVDFLQICQPVCVFMGFPCVEICWVFASIIYIFYLCFFLFFPSVYSFCPMSMCLFCFSSFIYYMIFNFIILFIFLYLKKTCFIMWDRKWWMQMGGEVHRNWDK